MKKSRYTEEQIAFALKQAELGTTVEEICRILQVARSGYYAWLHAPLALNTGVGVLLLST